MWALGAHHMAHWDAFFGAVCPRSRAGSSQVRWLVIWMYLNAPEEFDEPLGTSSVRWYESGSVKSASVAFPFGARQRRALAGLGLLHG